nr:hypothetical protein [Tanacetum cinerariifolium]GEY16539.1 hypothetical protein [Tanacetum cinerariifolium]
MSIPSPPVLSARSCPTEDLQCSSHSLNSINAIKTCSKETNHSQKDQLQTVMETKTRQSKELEQTIEDEFKDLHINLPVLEVLAYAPIYNATLDKYVESLKLSKNGSAFIQGEMPVKMEDLGLFTLPCKLGDSKPFDTLADLGSCVNIIPLPRNPLLVGRGFLATANAVIDCRKAKIAIGEGISREWEIARDDEIDPFKDVLVFRRMVEFLWALPINLKGNMWESEDLIENPINRDKPPKNEDEAWHSKIRLIDPDKERFTKTFQSIPNSRKLFEKENPREMIDLDHFHNTWTCDSESSYKTR